MDAMRINNPRDAQRYAPCIAKPPKQSGAKPAMPQETKADAVADGKTLPDIASPSSDNTTKQSTRLPTDSSSEKDTP